LAMQGAQLGEAGTLADAEARLQKRLDLIAAISDAQIAAAVLERVRDRIVAVAQSESLKGLAPAFNALDAAIKPKRDEGKKLVKEVPHIGAFLTGVADTPTQAKLRGL